MISGLPVVWESKKQSLHAQSSAEAEFISAASAVKTGIWINSIVKEPNLHLPKLDFPFTLFIDSRSCMDMIKQGSVPAGRSKYIDVRKHLTLGQWEKGTYTPKWIPGNENIADIFTKTILSKDHFIKLQNELIQESRVAGECRKPFIELSIKGKLFAEN